MKLRDGFVSNSSTTSFTCDACGMSESWFDSMDGYESFGLNDCVNGHGICDDDLLELPEGWTPSDEFRKECEDWGYDEDDADRGGGRHCRAAEMCPVCTFLILSDRDLGRYLEKVSNATREEAFEEVKQANKRRKKLYEAEYVAFACNRYGKGRDEVFAEIKERFGEYGEFVKFLRAK